MAHVVVDAPPPTSIDPVTEVLHGVEIVDPYRWLEDQHSPLTRKWIEEQTAYTGAYLDAIPYRELIRGGVERLLGFKEVISEPWNVGNRYFFLKRQERTEQLAIVMKEGISGKETVLVDPQARGTGVHTAVSIAAISEDARFLAYSVREGGTDHSALEILDLERKMVLPDRLPAGFCTGFAFSPKADGFYYSHREVQDSRPNYRAVFWHRFGTERSQDQEIFFAGEQANLFVSIICSPEAKLLAYPVFMTGKQRQTSIYSQPLDRSENPTALIQEIEGCFIPFFVKDQLFAYTDFAAPNFRIVRIAISSPDPRCWQDVVAETRQRIQQFVVAADQVFVTRIHRFTTTLECFRLYESRQEEVAFSVCGSIDLLNRTMKSPRVFYGLTSVANPTSIHCYDTQEKTSLTWDETKGPVDMCEITVEEVMYPSGDKTLVPLLLAVRKDRYHSGSLPTFLTGYGGFGSCVTPRFTAFATFLIEQGFLFAVPALRGGSELGEEWHRAGMRENRQNSFDDFVAAAEWLIAEGRAVPGRIAIGGGSNAGLLVGAAITQRPDLFRAAICLGPLLDMTRYHLFDLAAGWADEYGLPDDEQDFHSLLAYSPYHRIQDGVAYPAVLLISGDADTRCNPMHARKMAARLQAATSSGHPALLDYKPSWGHTPVQPLSTRIDALTDRLAFICHELGVDFEQGRSL